MVRCTLAAKPRVRMLLKRLLAWKAVSNRTRFSFTARGHFSLSTEWLWVKSAERWYRFPLVLDGFQLTQSSPFSPENRRRCQAKSWQQQDYQRRWDEEAIWVPKVWVSDGTRGGRWNKQAYSWLRNFEPRARTTNGESLLLRTKCSLGHA